jgi:CRISPR/Cas system-associated endoribonuclease Cas2
MPYYLISYDTHYDRNYDSFYEAMEEYGGVSILESLWGIELLDEDAKLVRQWVVDLLDSDDSIIVLKMRPRHAYSTNELSKPALQWLTKMNGSA